MAIDLLSIQPGELKFPFEPRKQVSCSLQLVNQTQNYVAFKIKTTSPKKYCVRPNTGIVLPGSTCDVTVTMQAQHEAPPDMQSKDKFLVQSVVPDGAQQKEASQDLFDKAPGKEVNETKLRVVYVSPPQPPSPIPESTEEGVSPSPLTLDDGFDAAEEKEAAFQRSQQFQQDLTGNGAISEERNGMAMQPKPTSGFSFLFVLIVGLLGILVGYFLRAEI